MTEEEIIRDLIRAFLCFLKKRKDRLLQLIEERIEHRHGEALFEVFQEHIVESLPLFCLITGELSGIAKNLFQNRGKEVEVLLLTRLRPDGGSRGL